MWEEGRTWRLEAWILSEGNINAQPQLCYEILYRADMRCKEGPVLTEDSSLIT